MSPGRMTSWTTPIALLECVLDDDLAAAGAVLRNMDAAPVAASLACLAAGLAQAGEVVCGRRHLRAWSLAELLL